MSADRPDIGNYVLAQANRRESETTVTWRILERCLRNVHRTIMELGCPVFDAELPTRHFFERYFKNQDAMLLVEGPKSKLPAGSHGFTCKRTVEIDGAKRSLFVVLVSEIESDIEWLFTVAHEVGHILLHGRIIDPQMLLPRRSNWWYAPHFDRQRRLLEVEANMYAFFCVVPTALIQLVSEVTGREPNVADLQHAVSFLYRDRVGEDFIRERLALHAMNQGDSSDLCLKIESRREVEELQKRNRSWLWHGAGRTGAPGEITDSLDERQRGRILSEGRKRGIISKEVKKVVYNSWLEEQGLG